MDFEKWFGDFHHDRRAADSFDRDRFFFGSFGDVAGERILELGFGNGCLTRFLLRRGARVCSVDLSLEYCRFLARSDSGSSPVKAWAEILPFKGGSFDMVTAFVALHHFNLEMTLKEIHRILRPRGRGIFMEPLANSRLLYSLRQFIPIKDNESPGGGGLRVRELAKAFADHGFSFEIREFEFLTRFERLPFIQPLQRILRRVDHFLLTSLPFLRILARTTVIQIRKN
jgi:SAM-dependent methyltransferase